MHAILFGPNIGVVCDRKDDEGSVSLINDRRHLNLRYQITVTNKQRRAPVVGSNREFGFLEVFPLKSLYIQSAALLDSQQNGSNADCDFHYVRLENASRGVWRSVSGSRIGLELAIKALRKRSPREEKLSNIPASQDNAYAL